MTFNKKMTLFNIGLLTLLTVSQFKISANQQVPLGTVYSHKTHTWICHEKKFVWFRIDKTATRTIRHILKQKFNIIEVDKPIPWNKEEYRDYFKFSFVRNPWDRAVSAYFNKVVDARRFRMHPACIDKGFDYFVDLIDRSNVERGVHTHIKAQTSMMPVEKMNFIGRFENFEEDFLKVMNILGIVDFDMVHHNSTSRDHYTTYYDDRTKEIIARKYRKDIETFGYEFGK